MPLKSESAAFGKELGWRENSRQTHPGDVRAIVSPRSPPTQERKLNMSRKIIGFQSRKVAAFLAGLLTGVLIGGCSVFGPGLGVSVY